MNPRDSRPIRWDMMSLAPREHGGWSMAFEPVVLGLLAAPSAPGGALAGAVLAAFLARRPLQVLWGRRSPADDRLRGAALGLLVVCGAVAFGLTGIAAAKAGLSALWPLALALPPAGLFLRLDAQGEARAAGAELAGTIAFALLPAAFLTVAGVQPVLATSLSAAMGLRSIPAVLTLRAFLRRRKGERVGRWVPVLASGLALLGFAGLAAAQVAPWVAVGFGTLFFVRTAWLLGPCPPGLRATALGLGEAGAGAVFAVGVGLGWPPT